MPAHSIEIISLLEISRKDVSTSIAIGVITMMEARTEYHQRNHRRSGGGKSPNV